MNKIKQLIRRFVSENYGTRELSNPAWDIDRLAKFIDCKKPSIKQKVQAEILALLDEKIDKEIAMMQGSYPVATIAKEALYYCDPQPENVVFQQWSVADIREELIDEDSPTGLYEAAITLNGLTDNQVYGLLLYLAKKNQTLTDYDGALMLAPLEDAAKDCVERGII